MPSRDQQRGIDAARDARARRGLSATTPLACILTTVERDAGVPVICAPLTELTAGCCVPLPGGGGIIFVNGTEFVPRRRFTLAHEYGHFVLGHAGAPDAKSTLAGRAYSSHEVQANAFAGEFLAPAAGVLELVDGKPTLETAGAIAGRYAISVPAAIVRLNRLGFTACTDHLFDELKDPAVRAWVQPAAHDDELARVHHLPRIPPALENTELAAVLRGDAPAGPALSRALPLVMP